MVRPRHQDTGKWGVGTWIVVLLLVAGAGVAGRYAWPHLRPWVASLGGGLGARVELRLTRDGRALSAGRALGQEQAVAGDVPAFQVTGVDEPFLAVSLCPPSGLGGVCELLFHGPTPGQAWLPSATRLRGGLHRLELLACQGQAELRQAVATTGPPPAGCRAATHELDVRP